MRVERRVFGRARNYHLALISEALAPLIRLAARVRTGVPTPNVTWRKGLIVGHSHIGDVLYRTASLPILRRALPECRWHYLTAPLAAQVLQGNPDIDRIMPLVKGDNSWNLAQGGFRALQAERYDVALCTNSLRHHADLLLATALGIPNRVAYSHKGLSGLITAPVAIDYPSPYPAYFRSMVAALADRAPDWPLVPRLMISPEDEKLAAESWSTLGLTGRTVVACCPTTRQAYGAWPARFFTESLERAFGDKNATVVFCGAPGDAQLLQSMAAQCTLESRVMAGTLPLRSFAAFLARVNLVFSQDSGPRHLANAVGTPVAFFRNLTMTRAEVGPYCDGERDVAPAEGELASEAEREELYRTVDTSAIATILRSHASPAK